MFFRSRIFSLYVGPDYARWMRLNIFLGLFPRPELATRHHSLPHAIEIDFSAGMNEQDGLSAWLPNFFRLPDYTPCVRWTGRRWNAVGPVLWPYFFRFKATPWPVRVANV